MPDKELLDKENKTILEILKTIQQYGMGALSKKEMTELIEADKTNWGDNIDEFIKEQESLISGERDGEYLSAEQRKTIVRKRRMKSSKFFSKGQTKTAADTIGTGSLAVRSNTGKISSKKFIPEPTEEKGGSLAEILTGVNSIVETLKAGQKQDKKHKNFLQRMVERFKRRRDENKLEFKILDGIKKTASTLLKPFKSAWQKMLDFIGKVLLGRVLFKVLEWMGNKENQGKLNSIIKFFEDWWPVLLGGYLIFGNALTGFALGLLKNVVVWGAKLVATVIPALLKAAVALGPWGIAAAAVLGGGIYLATRGKKDEESPPDQEMGDDGVTEETQGFKGGGLVQHYNNSTQQASNIIQGFNEGGIVTDPEEKRQQEEYMLKFVNDERALQGMEPLTDLTYAPGVELTKMVGPGPRTKETTDTFTDLDRGIETTSTSKTVDGKTTFGASMRQTTEEDRQKFFAENPQAAQLLNIKDQFELDSLGADISASARPQKLKQGGFVSGPGGVDKVPARLTAGEFVMSKGAVQKYGVNTLKSMNAAGGGTNIPTLMGGKPGYEGGGLVEVEAGSINSYQDAIDAGIQVEDTIVGNQRYGKIRWKEKMPRGFFGLGKQKYRVMGTKWLSSGFGSEHNKTLAMSTEDYVNMKMDWSGASSSSAKVEPAKPKMVRGQGNKLRAVPSKSSDPNIQPSEKKKVTVAYEEEKDKMSDKPSMDKPGKEIPPFGVTKGRSPQKMKVLGISV